jgi:hypothetical protein
VAVILPERCVMTELAPPIAYVQMDYVRVAQADQAPPADAAPAPPPTKVDVSQYIPDTATRVTIIVTVTPPTGSVLIYPPGYQDYPYVFKGPKSSGEVRLSGPFVYVQLADGATAFNIQYLNYIQP